MLSLLLTWCHSGFKQGAACHYTVDMGDVESAVVIMLTKGIKALTGLTVHASCDAVCP